MQNLIQKDFATMAAQRGFLLLIALMLVTTTMSSSAVAQTKDITNADRVTEKILTPPSRNSDDPTMTEQLIDLKKQLVEQQKQIDELRRLVQEQQRLMAQQSEGAHPNLTPAS